MRDKCGIVGIYSQDKKTGVASQIYYALYALQHRGQESAGISTFNGNDILTHRGMGLVCDVFNPEKLEELKGNVGIGHVRYSTTGESRIENSQPFWS
ncbi:MAG: amidophosphoribosyltransferase, partial [Methanothermobacter sp.]|nr:amidophosphoribosyltransferase [Methanothermobacter sp.]